MKGESLEVSLQLSALSCQLNQTTAEIAENAEQNSKIKRSCQNVFSAFSAGSAVEDFADG
jgi:hypothetical protein